jgi:hypothetical protein
MNVYERRRPGDVVQEPGNAAHMKCALPTLLPWID